MDIKSVIIILHTQFSSHLGPMPALEIFEVAYEGDDEKFEKNFMDQENLRDSVCGLEGFWGCVEEYDESYWTQLWITGGNFEGKTLLEQKLEAIVTKSLVSKIGR